MAASSSNAASGVDDATLQDDLENLLSRAELELDQQAPPALSSPPRASSTSSPHGATVATLDEPVLTTLIRDLTLVACKKDNDGLNLNVPLLYCFLFLYVFMSHRHTH